MKEDLLEIKKLALELRDYAKVTENSYALLKLNKMILKINSLTKNVKL